MTLGERLKAARTARGWSYDKLARMAEVAKGTVVEIERGRSPRIDTLRRIADALGVSLDDLCPPESAKTA